MKIFMGIDPGFSGAIASILEIDGQSKSQFVQDMPILNAGKNQIDLVMLRDIFIREQPVLVYLEKAQTMPGQGISSSGRYMESYGIIKGMLAALRIPFVEITPQRWKKAMMADMPREKEASIVKCNQLFPKVSLPRKKDHGKADALLIAEFCRRENGNV